MKVLLTGATGLVGGLCLEILLSHPKIDQVIVAGRRPCGRVHDKVKDVSFDEACEESPDSFISSLGTTMAKAGSRQAFWAVDVDLPLRLARASKARGCQHAMLVSSVGSNAASPFAYLQAKADAESGFRAIEFASLSLLRPCFILGERPHHRQGERMALRLLQFVAPLLKGRLSQFRPIEAGRIAASLAVLCTAPLSGERVYYYDDMATLAPMLDQQF